MNVHYGMDPQTFGIQHQNGRQQLRASAGWLISVLYNLRSVPRHDQPATRQHRGLYARLNARIPPASVHASTCQNPRHAYVTKQEKCALHFHSFIQWVSNFTNAPSLHGVLPAPAVRGALPRGLQYSEADPLCRVFYQSRSLAAGFGFCSPFPQSGVRYS